ncbi:DJ-1/PfpI family protein [Geomonas subterranea]|uniref:DJ-1/PfpI family protein n=1 Tax=Geomonas subterranea TaxID=2847989 RepID=A0ABX8LEV0_9BACT|nr:DJ-1/PfpI family protein [Geomonas subterranea]QXE89234.1 DJ-1/PfpI family protein [Geomonas subterranea]QXM08654.1 DJ-1/PfpI family protein [Geomonas subterranea]
MKRIDIRNILLRFLILPVFLAAAVPAIAADKKQPASQEPLVDLRPSPARTVKTIGVLIYPGFEMLDAYGPMEMWGNLKHIPAVVWGGEEKRVTVRVVTIAAKRGEVASNQGPKTVADFGFGDAPRLDYLLVPGGIGAIAQLQDRETLNWLRERAAKTELVMSVCNGASLLAAAGILDDRPATTNKMFWKDSTQPGPKVQWVKKARWVDDGTVVTSSGISAGMDMSLAVIGRLYGKDIAAWLERLTEYEAHRDPSWDPFAVKAGLVQ